MGLVTKRRNTETQVLVLVSISPESIWGTYFWPTPKLTINTRVCQVGKGRSQGTGWGPEPWIQNLPKNQTADLAVGQKWLARVNGAQD